MASVVVPDDIDWDQYMVESDPRALVRPASAFMPEVERYLLDGPGSGGDLLPWEKTYSDIRCRPGEVSVWAGINGHGKSLLLGQVMLGFMRAKRKCLIASFEMQPRATLARMARQASQGNAPSSDFLRQFARWTDGRLWIYDQQVTIKSEQMLAVCRYANQELGMHHIVIDSLMKCVRGEDDYNGQKEFLDALTTLARASNMHIHLVHHMRKGGDEKSVGGKFDLKGSGSITDQVDNVFIVWRNKAKQFAAQEGEIDDDKPDALLVCEKQRHFGEGEGKFALWFHQPSMQYVERAGQRAQEFLS
jgi:twinkle protein